MRFQDQQNESPERTESIEQAKAKNSKPMHKTAQRIEDKEKTKEVEKAKKNSGAL